MSAIKEFFDQFGKLTDILNVGRLIFYTTAGAAVVVPAYLIVRLLIEPPAPLTMHISKASAALAAGWTPWVVAFASVVVGFMIAAVAFPVIDTVITQIRGEASSESSGGTEDSIARNYPLLRNNHPTEDYVAWVISEYWRYVEIVTYIPLGAIAGLVLTEVYVLLAILWDASREPAAVTGAHVFFGGGLVALAVIRYSLWPDVWLPRVVVPTIRTYLTARRDLIAGVKEQKRKSGSGDAAKPTPDGAEAPGGGKP